ncbi:MAG TPA: hypothetical protein VL485_26320 [Ktedonobacteraceae bacterium]|jgi:hypothetical protein|nr:hypothetical protein [Ktedonobacteraceae bacterium]
MLHGFAKRLVFLVVSGISLLLLGLMMPITSYAHSAQDGDGYYSHHPKIEIAKKAFLVVIKQKHDDEKAADTQDRVEKRFTKAIVVALFFKCFPKKEDLDSHKKGFIVVFVKQIVKFKGYVKVIWGKTVIFGIRCDGKKHLALAVVEPFKKFTDETFHSGKAFVKAILVDPSRKKAFDKELVWVIKFFPVHDAVA